MCAATWREARLVKRRAMDIRDERAGALVGSAAHIGRDDVERFGICFGRFGVGAAGTRKAKNRGELSGNDKGADGKHWLGSGLDCREGKKRARPVKSAPDARR